jgi:hypothetical protein
VALANVDVESRVNVLVLGVGTSWCGDGVTQLVVVCLVCSYLCSVEQRHALLLYRHLLPVVRVPMRYSILRDDGAVVPLILSGAHASSGENRPVAYGAYPSVHAHCWEGRAVGFAVRKQHHLGSVLSILSGVCVGTNKLSSLDFEV